MRSARHPSRHQRGPAGVALGHVLADGAVLVPDELQPGGSVGKREPGNSCASLPAAAICSACSCAARASSALRRTGVRLGSRPLPIREDEDRIHDRAERPGRGRRPRGRCWSGRCLDHRLRRGSRRRRLAAACEADHAEREHDTRREVSARNGRTSVRAIVVPDAALDGALGDGNVVAVDRLVDDALRVDRASAPAARPAVAARDSSAPQPPRPRRGTHASGGSGVAPA